MARALVAGGALIAVALLLGAVEREVWRRQLGVTGVGGDALQYYRIALQLARTGSFSFDGHTPEWTRLPGYPVVLWAAGPTPDTDRTGFRRWLVLSQRINLAMDLATALLVVLLARSLGAGRAALAGGLAWVLQPWATVIGVITLSDVCATFLTAACLAALLHAMAARGWRRYLLVGALVAAGQYLRSDAILLLLVVVVGALLAGAWRGALACVLVWAVLYSPWPLRNAWVFGSPHPLGGGLGIGLDGEPTDRSAAWAWMRTWAWSEEHTTGVAWRLPGLALRLEDLPPEALGSPEETRELAAILTRYAVLGNRLDGALSDRFRRLADERTRRAPLHGLVVLPVLRASRMLLPPRDGYGMNELYPLRLLRPLYLLGDAILVLAGLYGIWRGRRSPAVRVLALVLGLRLVLVAWLPCPEPRYFLPALPVLYALAAAALGAHCGKVTS